MRAAYFSIIAVLAVFSLMGCSGKKESADKPAFVVVVFDPAVGADTRKEYAAAFAGVVDSLKSGDVILGGATSDKTEQTFSFRVEASIPTFDAMKDSPMEYDAKIAVLRKQQKDEAQKLLNVHPENSDITGGFMEAAKAFNGDKCKGFERQILIVFTDGIEQNKRHNFAAKGELSGDSVSKIIAKEKQLGRLPSLAGVQVYFVGICSEPDPKADMTEQKMSDVRRFWADYCKATGAVLDPNNYGRSFVNFKLH